MNETQKKEAFIRHPDGVTKIEKGIKFSAPSLNRDVSVILTEENTIVMLVDKNKKDGSPNALIHLSINSAAMLFQALLCMDTELNGQLHDFVMPEDTEFSSHNFESLKHIQP